LRLLVDECCDRLLVSALRQAGHDVLSVAETMAGEPDESVLLAARESGRVLVTYDYDFGELTVRHGLPVPGVILVACHGLAPLERARRTAAALAALADDGRGWLTMIEPKRVRRRPVG
jgi:predicted nuclease of predicted toxin-antitoxin system